MSTDLLTDNAPAPVASDAAPASAPATETTAPIEGGGWLPSEYANEPSLKDFKDVSGLAKSYMSLNSERGRSVRVPGPDAGKEDLDKFYARITNVKGVMRTPDDSDAEAMTQFYNSLGRPAESKDYAVDLGENQRFVDPSQLEAFKKIGHEAGLSSSQLKKMVEFDIARSAHQSDADVNAATNAVSVLQQRWGNEYNNRIAGAKAAFRTYQTQFPEGFQELERVAKNNPALVAILSDIGRTMSEKGLIDAPHAYGGTSADEAIEKIAEIRNNREHAFHTASAVGHKEAKAKMTSLYKQAYPDNR